MSVLFIGLLRMYIGTPPPLAAKVGKYRCPCKCYIVVSFLPFTFRTNLSQQTNQLHLSIIQIHQHVRYVNQSRKTFEKHIQYDMILVRIKSISVCVCFFKAGILCTNRIPRPTASEISYSINPTVNIWPSSTGELRSVDLVLPSSIFH